MGEKTEQGQSGGVNIAGKLGVSAGALRTFFRTLGTEVSPERLEDKLVEIAEHYKQALAQATTATSDDPDVAKLKRKVISALEAGELERADDLLAQVQAVEDAALERRQLEAAATAAQRGNIALTRLRYRDAAEHFAAAARRVPPGHEEQFLAYLDQEASALYQQGDELGDKPALAYAIDRYRALLKGRTREQVPLQWATAQHDLGKALRSLGDRESGTSGRARLGEAVDAFREALEELTLRRVEPLHWARMQHDLGTALLSLGALAAFEALAASERESGRARLEQAVAAFHEALEERTRERVPLDWARTQNNLGRAFWILGRENGGELLEKAVAAFREALTELNRQRVPLQWATAQHNLANALSSLGERAQDREKLQEARNTLNAALEVFCMQAGQERYRPYLEERLRRICSQLDE